MPKTETRSIKVAVRAIKETASTPKRIGGVIPFNSPSEYLCDEVGMSADEVRALRAAGGCFREIIAPGAFNFGDVRALVNHDSWPIMGRTTSNTFRVEQKDDGLHYELVVPDSPSGADLYCSVDRGDVGGVSFDFAVRDDGDSWDFKRVPPPVRTLPAPLISAKSASSERRRTRIPPRQRVGSWQTPKAASAFYDLENEIQKLKCEMDMALGC